MRPVTIYNSVDKYPVTNDNHSEGLGYVDSSTILEYSVSTL